MTLKANERTGYAFGYHFSLIKKLFFVLIGTRHTESSTSPPATTSGEERKGERERKGKRRQR